jgi:hypothetical protein
MLAPPPAGTALVVEHAASHPIRLSFTPSFLLGLVM